MVNRMVPWLVFFFIFFSFRMIWLALAILLMPEFPLTIPFECVYLCVERDNVP